ncbi:MAG TPA: BatA domain-containing protein [Gemmatimonadaceae bacterium]|nr:BatA domain-containing protein [Gemmatimonadaceae bacterium]
MSFLAPWALLAGAVAAAGLVVLHLVARQRPAAYPLPTARFVPDRRTLVSRASRRPHDLLLLALRVILVLSAAAAFARPVLTPHRAPRARVLLLDRSAATADLDGALRRAREIVGDGVPTQVLVFDTTVIRVNGGEGALDSAVRAPAGASKVAGSLSAALAAARRVGAEVGAGADSVELVLLSPVTSDELDVATDGIRATWPGGIRLVRLPARADSAALPALERAVSDAAVLGPALDGRTVKASPTSVRLVHGPLTPADSDFARGGGVVVRWDSIGARALVPSAVAMGDDVFVAALGRDTLKERGTALARWADGAPAAVESVLGGGCVRRVGIGVPVAGDLPLSPTFQRIVNGLSDACTGSRARTGMPVDSARVSALVAGGGAASGSVLASGTERPAPVAPWLLALALACALAELLLRRRSEAEAA